MRDFLHFEWLLMNLDWETFCEISFSSIWRCWQEKPNHVRWRVLFSFFRIPVDSPFKILPGEKPEDDKNSSGIAQELSPLTSLLFPYLRSQTRKGSNCHSPGDSSSASRYQQHKKTILIEHLRPAVSSATIFNSTTTIESVTWGARKLTVAPLLAEF
jgi:hypothetical protein